MLSQNPFTQHSALSTQYLRMLHRSHLITALEQRREDFTDFARAWDDDVRGLARSLRSLSARGAEAIRREVGAPARRVSFPSAELDERRSFTIGFDRRWRTHEEARRWALDVLSERVTFAADGSQIMPGREISLPVAGVQVAWFENPHTGEGTYTKDARFFVVTPKELLQAEGGAANPGPVVNARRTKIEVDCVCDFLERVRGWESRGERAPLAFFDGTFLLSSARQHTENLFFSSYAREVARLVRVSREMRVPVVGYIDQSYARDITTLIEALGGGAKESGVYDAQLLRSGAEDDSPQLGAWGDRTVFTYCLRDGLTGDFYGDDGEPLVGFVYVQTTGEGMPARLDVPAWVYDAGLINEVLDVVRAECVVGNGYPYAIEAADAAAVITSRDREQFLRVMQEFAERERFGFSVSRKAVSKLHRR